MRKLTRAVLIVFAILSGTVCSEVSTRTKQQLVEQAAPAEVAELGRHIIVGYRNPQDLFDLIDRQAIAGVFLTTRNVGNKSYNMLREELAVLQDRQRQHGGSPLLIASDQEGGIVSRLSPPLTLLPSLSSVIADTASKESVATRVARYAQRQGRELADLGVNVNFGPVVDLAGKESSFPEDEYSLLSQRAISDVPTITTEVATIYCQEMRDEGVMPTLKHFPGLGKIRVDTHRYLGVLNGSVEELEQHEWLPFKNVGAIAEPFIMVGHVTIPSVDPNNPASSSRKVIEGILRKRWGYQGIVITDDFSMSPVFFAKGSAGTSAVRSLNAGVDLILIGQRSEELYPVLAALLKAKRSGTLSVSALNASANRLSKLNRWLESRRSEYKVRSAN